MAATRSRTSGATADARGGGQDTVEIGARVRRARTRTRARPGAVGVAARLVVLAALVALVLAAPLLVPDFQVQIVTQAAIYAIVALSMNVLMGYAGQVSLGHAAFYGIGAFIAGVTVSKLLAPAVGAGAGVAPAAADAGVMGSLDPLFQFVAALLMAGSAGAVAALLLGAVALRLRGLYLALVTIAYGALAQETLFKLPLFNGGAGVAAPRPPLFDSDVAYTYVVIGSLALFLALDWRLTASKAGRAIQALRDDERVAASWGINVTGYKLLAFTISGILAGVAGAFFAFRNTQVSDVEFTFTVSLIFVLMTVVGGLGNRWGVVQGGIIFAVLPTLFEAVAEWHVGERAVGELLSFTVPLTTTRVSFGPTLEPVIAALLLILTLMFFPRGLAQLQAPLQRWLSFGPLRQPDEGPAVGGGTGGGGMGARP